MVTYEKGEVILRQGEKADCMYLVHSGVIGIFKDYGTNHANKVAEVHEGEYLGKNAETGKPMFKFIEDDDERENSPVIRSS